MIVDVDISQTIFIFRELSEEREITFNLPTPDTNEIVSRTIMFLPGQDVTVTDGTTSWRSTPRSFQALAVWTGEHWGVVFVE